jgi:hypothetical protein
MCSDDYAESSLVRGLRAAARPDANVWLAATDLSQSLAADNAHRPHQLVVLIGW